MTWSVPLLGGPSSDSEVLRRGARRAAERRSPGPESCEISPRKGESEAPIRGTIRLMADDPEKRGDEPNLELPSLLGFRRKKKERETAEPAETAAVDETTEIEPVAPQVPEAPEAASQP